MMDEPTCAGCGEPAYHCSVSFEEEPEREAPWCGEGRCYFAAFEPLLVLDVPDGR